MRALVLEDDGLAFRSSYDGRQPGPREIPVRVLLAGICETDLQLVRGYMDFRGVLGHEFVGVAETGEHAGHRVVGEINCGCERCQWCSDGLRNHCPQRTVIGILNHDGAFADRVFVPEVNLHRVPDNVSDERAVFTEPLAAALRIPQQVDLSKHSSAVVVGDGRMAFLIAQVLRREDLDVHVVGKHPNKLRLFQANGFHVGVCDAKSTKREFSLAVDCSGSNSGIMTAVARLKPGGTLVLKTTNSSEHGPSLAPAVIDEITIVGSRCGPFDAALSALQASAITVEPLITARFPLEKGADAFAAASSSEHLKILLDIGPLDDSGGMS